MNEKNGWAAEKNEIHNIRIRVYNNRKKDEIYKTRS